MMRTEKCSERTKDVIKCTEMQRQQQQSGFSYQLPGWLYHIQNIQNDDFHDKSTETTEMH